MCVAHDALRKKGHGIGSKDIRIKDERKKNERGIVTQIQGAGLCVSSP